MLEENENRKLMNSNALNTIAQKCEMMQERSQNTCECKKERNQNTCGCNQERNQNTCECNQEKREAMLKQIKCLEFAIVELAQYLDTHPNDERAICLHNRYCKECKELKDKYQKVYGPLTINYPCNKWRWIEEPWPWEGDRN